MAINFKGAHFPPEVILMGIRWYIAYPLSTRHVEELMEERGVQVDHSTINRWVIKYSPQLEEAFQRRKRPVWVSWRMDETYIKVTGQWSYLYRAVAKPTVSPTKNSLVYFISIVYTDHPVWRSHREEAKRGPPSGHRITRNGAAMVSLLLPYATTGLSRIAGRCLIGATPRGQPRTPVSCTVRRPFVGRPVPRQLMRNELFDLTTIVPATAYHRRSYAERYSRSMSQY